MAYTPNAATQAALTKQRTGQKLTPAEQSLITAHSKAVIADMSPRIGGSGQPYDYSGSTNANYSGSNGGTPTGATTGGQLGSSSDIAERYYNFINSEQLQRSQGLPPRPLPAQFSQIAQTYNPLGYNLNDTNSYQIPTQNSAGYAQLSAAGLLPGQKVSTGVITPNPYNNPVSGTPQPNPGTTPTQISTNPTATLPFNPTTALPSAPMTVHTPNGGLALGNTTAGIDEGKLLSEAEMQKQLRQQTYEQQVAGRKAMLDELSGVLQKQQQGMLNDQMPGIYEDLNTRGLLRSSALGEKVGLEASKLARQTSEQLALQGITDRDTAINDLSGIEDAYLGGRGAALQRRFSLEDFDRQLDAGKELGANAMPQISQPSGKGSGALQGALGGGGIGATVGGPTGAIVGSVIGGIGGGKLGGK